MAKIPRRPSRAAALLRAEHDLRFANSYNLADAILEFFRLRHPRRVEILGEEWSCCDTYPPEMKELVHDLRRPTWEAMDEAERLFLGNLPEVVTVWRGCYHHNKAGMSWSTDREVAARIPTLTRYLAEGQPLLLEGRIRRDRIAFVKLDRTEYEVICSPEDVTIIEVEYLMGLAA